jgi:hypothetical protein
MMMMIIIVAIQDKVIPVKNYRKYILKEDLEDDTCRRCEKAPETIEHITGSCTSLTNMQYSHRHNNVAKIIHQQIAIDKKLLTMYTPYYKYTAAEVFRKPKIQTLLGQRSKNGYKSFSKQTRYPTV